MTATSADLITGPDSDPRVPAIADAMDVEPVAAGKTVRCYKFWAVPASAADNTLLSKQLHLAGNYRHELVDIENRCRFMQRLWWAHPMRHIPADQQEAWRKDGGGEILKAWTKTEEYKQGRSLLEGALRAAGRAARANAVAAGLHYGTYWLVEQSVGDAARTTAWASDLGHVGMSRVGAPVDPNKKPTVEQLDDADGMTRVWLGREKYALGARVDGFRARATSSDHRNHSGQIAAKKLSLAKIRVGTQPTGLNPFKTTPGRRAPIWAALHVLQHRPLPAGRVAQAWAQRHFVGGRARWEVVFAVEVAEVERASAAPEGTTVGVDIGWRRLEDVAGEPGGIRIAYWWGDHQTTSCAAEGALVIPHEVERRKAKSEDLRSIRDKNRNRFVDAMVTEIRCNPGTWLDEIAPHAPKWTRVSHFHKLERRLRAELPDEAWAFGLLERLVAHNKQDQHLHLWEAHNLTKMKRQILGRIAAWAAEIAKRFRVIAVEDIDLRALKEKPIEGVPINSRQIQKVAPGEIIAALAAAVAKRGGHLHKIPPQDTTRTCSDCGFVRDIEDTQLEQICRACGHAEDQDRTAAKNLCRWSEAARDHHGRPVDLREKKTKKKLAPRRTRKAQRAEATP